MKIGLNGAGLALCLGLFAAGLAQAAPATSSKIEPALLQAVQQAGESDFMIFMDAEADLSAAAAQKTRTEKSRVVMAALKATAAKSQAGVLAELRARGIEHRAFWLANAISARGTLADLQAIAARSEVRQLLKIDNRLPQMLPPTIARQPERPTGAKKAAPAAFNVAKVLGDTAEPGVKLINAPAVWAMGFKGQGVVVGDHDVGVKWDHPALKKQYRGWNGTTASHDYNWRNAFGMADVFCTDPVVPCDSNGHGTHTTGTMVGYDGGENQVGVAPEAKWMACRSLLDPVLGVGTVPTYMDCMEWQLAPYPNGNPDAADPAMGPDVISNSWGCVEACAPPVLKAAGDAIYAAGQVQVVSAGNDGQGTVGGEGGEASCSTLAFPTAVYESSFTVGANDVSDEMASFSSLGPVLSDASMRLKPNVSAPGVNTRSTWNDDDYDTISGTSMAGPHVAGMIALIMSAEPRLIGRVADVRTLVERTANPKLGTTETASTCGGTAATVIPNNIFGFGRIDALAAVLARPRLTVALTAPATAKTGDSYEATLTVAQPAAGKIDVTTALVDVTLPATATLVGSTPAPSKNTLAGATRTLQYSVAKLEPGKSATVKITVKSDAAGEIALASKAEADQVSPVAGSVAKTVVSSGIVTPPVTTPATATSDGGRYGGGFGLMALAMLGGTALRRRRV